MTVGTPVNAVVGGPAELTQYRKSPGSGDSQSGDDYFSWNDYVTAGTPNC